MDQTAEREQDRVWTTDDLRVLEHHGRGPGVVRACVRALMHALMHAPFVPLACPGCGCIQQARVGWGIRAFGLDR